MFISQVIFESDIANKDRIEGLMENKKSNLESADGLISSECWWKEGGNTVGFSLVGKWNDRASFQTWLKESHKDGHKKPDSKDANETKITKTLHQFEMVEE